MKMGMKFIVYGIVNAGNRSGFATVVDFASLIDTPCNMEDDFDYEEWIPNFPNGECSFGKKIGYLRRKPYVMCYNPDDLTIARVKGFCSCTLADWECAENYYRDINGTCLSPAGQKVTKLAPENCETYYTVPTAYKKVPESECERGLDLSGEVYPCPKRRNIK